MIFCYIQIFLTQNQFFTHPSGLCGIFFFLFFLSLKKHQQTEKKEGFKLVYLLLLCFLFTKNTSIAITMKETDKALHEHRLILVLSLSKKKCNCSI